MLTRKQRNVRALLFFLSFYVVFGITLTLFQERVIYRPGSQDFHLCLNMPEATLVEMSDTRMYTHLSEKGVVVVYHGNAGSACDRAFYAEQILASGYGYIIPEYSGYSNDGKQPTHERIKANVTEVIAFLKNNNVSTTLIIGESIGTGIASYHASLAEPQALLLISPFYDLVDVARNRFWFYPSFLTENAFTNGLWLHNATYPITIVHGSRDNLVPYNSGHKLYDSLTSGNKVFVTIPDGGHNDLFTYTETYTALNRFLRQETLQKN